MSCIMERGQIENHHEWVYQREYLFFNRAYIPARRTQNYIIGVRNPCGSRFCGFTYVLVFRKVR